MRVLFKQIYAIIQLQLFRFRNRNKHCIVSNNVLLNNETDLEGYNKIGAYSQIEGTLIGLGSYIGWKCILHNGEIGRFCSIAPHVECIYGQHPLYPMVSTHPSFFSLGKQAGFTFVSEQQFSEQKYIKSSNGHHSFKIGNDVWIGYGARIMEGIIIGDGAVIAAGAIVTKDVPPFQIWGGIPAKKIKDRFSEEQKKALTKIKWWNYDLSYLNEISPLFKNIDEFLKHEGIN